MFVSVNLSAHDLVDREIINVISNALFVSGLEPSRLHLEVTESAVVDEPGLHVADEMNLGVCADPRIFSVSP